MPRMDILELSNSAEARQFLLASLNLLRIGGLKPDRVRPTLQWARTIVSDGQPLPLLGLVGDLGQMATAGESTTSEAGDGSLNAEWSSAMRSYEDHVLAKFFADRHFERASDIVRTLRNGLQDRGVAYLINQFRKHCDIGGVLLSPSVIKALLDLPPREVVSMAQSAWTADDHAMLRQQLLALVAACRRRADVLSADDVFELEHGIALADLGQRIALMQMKRASDAFLEAMPRRPLRVAAIRREVASALDDEDAYPVGGFASISTRGGIESLLQSQLAYMEVGSDAVRPDLFDIKYLREELLYYSRDDNQFLRRRRQFTIELDADLAMARFKDPDLPYQRLTMALGGLCALVVRLQQWLRHDDLRFHFVLPPSGVRDNLSAEAELLKTYFREAIALGTVAIQSAASDNQSHRKRPFAGRDHLHLRFAGEAPHRILPTLTIGNDLPDLQADWHVQESEPENRQAAWEQVFSTMLLAWGID